jgi:hypothetical protein
MKFKFILPLLFFITLFSFAQQDQLKWLDLNLSNYDYPYPVHFITLKVQQQELKWSIWMWNQTIITEKIFLLLHGKTSTEPIGKTIAALTKKDSEWLFQIKLVLENQQTRSLSIYISTTGTKHKTNFRYTRDWKQLF